MKEIHPIEIGSVSLKNNLFLAPMAGVNDLPFRRIASEFGAGLVVSEMVSAKAITFKNKNTVELLKTDEAERPVAVQLFGSEEDSMEEAAEFVSNYPFDIIDINMGCPVEKVVKNGDG
ncbi:MAG: tRNA-dihydrouridine synthase, partial [Lachnospiraceae bacterium]|nr:tRNA-dihydrouridine synthase [Lachnospiraceae bacterium]